MNIHPDNFRYFSEQGTKTFIPIGHNICWPRWEQDEETVFAQYESFFSKMQQNGANYTRIWLSCAFLEPELSFGQFDDAKGRRARIIQDLARKYDIKIKFCICHFRHIQDNVVAFPGSVTFGQPAWHAMNGGSGMTLGDYLITEVGRDDFLARLDFWKRHLVNDETIFAMELWNEMNCVDALHAVWHKWTEDMLPELRKRFPGQLVTQSVGGYDSYDRRESHEPMWQMPENDIIQVHLYMHPDSPPGHIRRKPMDELLWDTIHKVNYSANDRPLLFAETGVISLKQHAGPSDLYSLDPNGSLFHDSLFAPFFSGAAGTGQFWHWEQTYIDRFDLYWHYSRFNKSIEGIDPAKERFAPFRLPNALSKIYGLAGHDTTLIWCRNPACNYRDELIAQKEPAAISGAKIKLQQAFVKSGKVTFYDPWTDESTSGTINDSLLQLPSFERSLVIRIQ